jgi:SAM-dependent methyltransferase
MESKQLMRLTRMLKNYLMRQSKKMSREGLYEFISDSLAGLKKDQKVLNVGSGGQIGNLVNQICKLKESTVLSIDIDPHRDPDMVCDVCELPFYEEFDVVVCAEVLEHISRPHIALTKIFSSLKGNGYLVMTVPFIFPIHDKPYDFFRYTRYGLEYLLQEFSEVHIREKNNGVKSLCVLLVRFLMMDSGNSKMGGGGLKFLFAITGILLYPLAVLISCKFQVDFLTTGYHIIAKKTSDVSNSV